jgi:RimJ/RimL family protein N-acetyltransferase
MFALALTGMLRFTLDDGRLVTIRPIRTDDRERLQQSHARLSPESQYRRFLSTKPALTSADARYLVDIDGLGHVALVATVTERGDEAIVAVARFVCIPGSPGTAEFAIVVGDDYQRQGLARELVATLVEAAAERGIRRFRATMFADNLAIHRLLEHHAVGEPRRSSDGPVSELEIDLPPHRVDGSPAPAMIAACPGS